MYTIYGSETSEHTIVAIPALGERKEMYESLAKLMPDYKWIVFDLPGSQQQLVADASISTFCAYIKTTLSEQNIEKAHFIGNSLGAWIIQAFAAKYKDFILTLTLLDGGHYFLGEIQEHQDETLLHGVENWEDIKIAVHDFVTSIPNLQAYGYEQFEAYMQNNYVKLPDGYAHHFNEKHYNELSKELVTNNYCLKGSSFPILVLLAGGMNNSYSVEHAKMYAKVNQHVDIKMIENGFHYLPLTNTKEVYELLKSFLSTKKEPSN